MTIKIGNITLKGRVLLAPMAGITDAPFRQLVSRYGAGLTTSEMIASQGLVQSNKDAFFRSQLGDATGLRAIQIAGREAEWMGKAAAVASDTGADIVDINMGCPAKKVTSGLSGSALMRDPDHALSLIDAVVKNSKIPVTLKMRLGWCHDSLNAAEIAKRAEDAGIQMIAIHGRTRMQFYKDTADWNAIKPIVEAVSIPVIANGDILNIQDAKQALKQSGAAGVMIGRGTQGKPWIPAQIDTELEGGIYTPPTMAARRALLIEHYNLILSHYGEELGIRIARKHISWSLADIFNTPSARKNLMTLTKPDTVVDAINNVFDQHQAAA